LSLFVIYFSKWRLYEAAAVNRCPVVASSISCSGCEQAAFDMIDYRKEPLPISPPLVREYDFL
jgi:hypothetical protein